MQATTSVPEKAPEDWAITVNGYNYFHLLSALQKDIRRGKEEQALYWAAQQELYSWEILWDRLAVIAVEDIGFADPDVLPRLRWLRAQYERALEKGNDSHRLFLGRAIQMLCRSPKSRITLDLAWAIYGEIEIDKTRRPIPPYALDHHTPEGSYKVWEEEGPKLVNESGEPNPYSERSKRYQERHRELPYTRPRRRGGKEPKPTPERQADGQSKMSKWVGSSKGEKTRVSGSVLTQTAIRGTKEWAQKNVNCVTGCSNRCRYCYGVLYAEKYGRGSRETWGEMKVRRHLVEKKYPKYRGRVMFPSTHDIPDNPEVKEACFTVLGKLLRAGNSVLIVSKPDPKVIREIIARFGRYRDQIEFMFTITSVDPVKLAFWEPGAPSASERVRALRFAHRAGWRTSVSAEPFLDYNPVPLVDAVSPYVTGEVWIGPMNHIERMGVSEEEQPMFDEVMRNYTPAHLAELYEALKDREKIRFKDSFLRRMEE